MYFQLQGSGGNPTKFCFYLFIAKDKQIFFHKEKSLVELDSGYKESKIAKVYFLICIHSSLRVVSNYTICF